MYRIFFALFAYVSFVSVANASTMTFNNFGSPSNTYSEDGIIADGNGAWVFEMNGGDERAHIDDRGTSYSSGITFSMSGRFDAIDFNLTPIANFGGDQFDNFELIGYRNGSQVAYRSHATEITPFHYIFTPGIFINLDSLYIGGLLPTIPVTGCDDLGQPCSHFDIDNVQMTLTSVPLPATAWVFGAGLLGLAGIRRFKNRVR